MITVFWRLAAKLVDSLGIADWLINRANPTAKLSPTSTTR